MTHPSAVGKVFRKPICPRGHDKRIVGVDTGRCLKCRSEDVKARNRRGHTREIKSFMCPKGHDKRIVGVRKTNGICVACDRERNKRFGRKKRAEVWGVPVEMVGCDADALKVREVRLALGFSVRGFARLVGVSKTTVQNIEAGRYKGRPTTRKKIVDALAEILANRRKRAKRIGRRLDGLEAA